MGLFSSLFGGNSKSSPPAEKRCSKDGTCFRTAADGKHVVIERRGGGAPSVGHGRENGTQSKGK